MLLSQSLQGFVKKLFLLIFNDKPARQWLKIFVFVHVGTVQHKYSENYFLPSHLLFLFSNYKIKSWLFIIVMISSLHNCHYHRKRKVTLFSDYWGSRKYGLQCMLKTCEMEAVTWFLNGEVIKDFIFYFSSPLFKKCYNFHVLLVTLKFNEHNRMAWSAILDIEETILYLFSPSA